MWAIGLGLIVMRDRPEALGPLGRRLLVAFVLVALSSVLALTAAALVGTSMGLDAGEQAKRVAAGQAVSKEAARAYGVTNSWVGADLARAADIAIAAGATLVVRDTAAAVVYVSSTDTGPGMGMGLGQGAGSGAGSGAEVGGRFVSAPVLAAGAEVGTVRLGFAAPTTNFAQTIAWTWIIIAAVVALFVAFFVAWFVARRISRPLNRLALMARSFAAGDRRVRADVLDATARWELGDLARAFDATADDVVRSEEARRRISADVAHELRTPLAALQAGLEELRDGLVSPDPERLAALHAQSVRLGRVVGDLAALSAAETAALSLRRSLIDVKSLVDDAVAAARPSIEGAGMTTTVECDQQLTIRGDADRLHQALGNLLANAARYCRPGDSVFVRVTSDPSHVLIAVADTGPGIETHELPRVFDRLWRGSTASDVAGSGIGLAVVRELVTAHGGSVEVASDGISGTTFTIRLQRAEG